MAGAPPQTTGTASAPYGRLIESAASLHERLASARDDADASASRDDLELVRPWLQAFSAGDEPAFLKRLEWDGLSLAAVARAVRSARVVDESGWSAWLPRFASAAQRARDTDAQPAGGQATQGDPGSLPFLELWLPLTRAARAELQRRSGARLAQLGEGALGALEQRLLQEISSVAEQATYERFRAETPQSSAPRGGDESAGRDAYERFVERTLASGMAALFDAYPVLPRMTAVLAETWVAATAELLERLDADRSALGERFAGGAPLGRVDGIEPLGDRHDGGRRVSVLVFAGGQRVVYKPRDVGLEQAFAGFVEWARREGVDLPPAPAVLERTGYGWMQFVAPGEFTIEAEVRRYFSRAGALLCVAHLLCGRDLHMENVVASLEGPQLVDAEMLLHPDTAEAPLQGGADEPQGRPASESCLGSGLLSLLQRDADGGVFDIGGLRGEGGGRAPVARRVWRALGSDAIHFVREPRFEPVLRNRVVLRGEPQRPEQHADAVLSGFAAAYQRLCARREALLAADGPLAAFAGRSVRVLPRTSTQYGALLYVLTSPRYLTSGLRRSFAMDSLNRRFAGAAGRPALWPLLADERRALEQLDVPRFTVDSAETTLVTRSGQRVLGWLRHSGLERLTARIQALGEDDLADQLELLRDALASPVGSRLETAPPQPAPPDGGASAEDRVFVEHARWLGRELLSRAAASAGGLAWRPPPDTGSRRGAGPLHLYDGASGPLLFLSALAAVTREARWTEAARSAVDAIDHAWEAPAGDRALPDGEPLGAASGLASIAYALALSGALLEEPSLLERALAFARLVTPERIAADRRLDVVGGLAGAALGLTAVHELSRQSWLLDRAEACARRLLSAAVRLPEGGTAWASVDGRLLAGMGHGAAGIACALARVGSSSGERQLLDVARSAFAFERALFSPAHRNWPVAGAGGTAPLLMAGWCHGAPGIGLARALAPSLLDDQLLSEIEVAMLTTAEAARQGDDHLCCGRLGRVDALLTAGRTLARSQWTDAARALGGEVADRARAERRFSLPGHEFTCRVFDPGFFKGLSGIGYQLLRLAAPAQVPSVLGWEVPERGGDER